MVLLGDDVDLGARRLLPFGDARVEGFVLLSADQLGVDGHAVKLAGQIGRTDRSRPSTHQCAGCYAGQKLWHFLLPSGLRLSPHQ
ncbi:hypothetical protein D3C72_2242640 [compost metagenome]